MLIRNANLLNPGTERGIYDILIREGKSPGSLPISKRKKK